MHIVMFGDFSGRNVGHNALLTALVDQVGALEPSRVTIPTLRPGAIRRVLGERHRTEPLGVAPWHGSVKFHGPRVRRAVERSDLILLVDNQLHEKGFGHPLKGNLRALISLTRRASERGVPVVYLHGSVGPLAKDRARTLASTLARQMDLVLLRDAAAERDLRGLAPEVPAKRTADAAFGLRSAAPAGDGRILVNLTAARASGDRETWVAALSRMASELDRRIVVAVTHPADRGAGRSLVEGLGRGIADLHAPSPEAFLREMPRELPDVSCAIGDRYHELVMFAALGIPVVGVEMGDKVEVLFEALGSPELLFDPSGDAGAPERLLSAVRSAWGSTGALGRCVEAAREALRSGTHEVRRLIGRT